MENHLLPLTPAVLVAPHKAESGQERLCCTQRVDFIFPLWGSCHSLLFFLAPSRRILPAAMQMLCGKKG